MRPLWHLLDTRIINPPKPELPHTLLQDGHTLRTGLRIAELLKSGAAPPNIHVCAPESVKITDTPKSGNFSVNSARTVWTVIIAGTRLESARLRTNLICCNRNYLSSRDNCGCMLICGPLVHLRLRLERLHEIAEEGGAAHVCRLYWIKPISILPVYRDNFKIKKLKSFFILKFYHSNSRRTLKLRKL
jgi:hypothetical protein